MTTPEQRIKEANARIMGFIDLIAIVRENDDLYQIPDLEEAIKQEESLIEHYQQYINSRKQARL